VASIERRIEVLEGLYSAGSGNLAEGSLERQEKMAASLRRAEGKAADEEALGDSRRRHALDSLYRFLERPC
jgi:hypothetical protein